MKAIIRQITTEETLAVRHPVLRSGRPREDCYFPGDDLESTVHFGVYDNDTLAGVATFLEKKFPDFEGAHLQLRGMAVLDQYKGKGFGKLLLKKGEQLAIENGICLIWCNARINAKPFYENFGYKTFGNSFEIPIIGTHFVLYKEISNISD